MKIKIKIIRGVYGFVDDNGFLKAKSSKDEPFELDEIEARELIEKGIAEAIKGNVKVTTEELPEKSVEESVEKPEKKSSKSKKKEADEDAPVLTAEMPE
jgi:hypothetical protein